MKTFRWTVPEFPLSAAEKRSHQKYRDEQSQPPETEEAPLSHCEPRNWRERWALHRLSNVRSPRSTIIFIVIYVASFTLVLYDREDFRRFLPFLWLLAALVIDQSIRDSATKSILQRLSRETKQEQEE